MLGTYWKSSATAFAVGFAVLIATPGISLAQATAPAKEKDSPKAKAKAKTKAKGTTTAKIDLNKATAEEMIEVLPGVGEATATRIIAGRPYTTVDGLEKAGIPSRTVEGIRSLVTVGNTAEEPKGKAGPSPKVAEPKPEPKPKPFGKIDLNKATAAELQELPGVGEATATAIIAGRPYQSVNDLEKVKGFGPAKVAALSGLVSAGTSPAPTTAKAEAPASNTEPKSKAKAANTPKATPAPGTPVNLNTATRAQLEALPFIGPVKAQAIIDARPYKAKEDIMKVLGIKQGVFDRIKESIRVD